MKLKIKVKVLTEGCMPEIISKGDLIDLRAAEDYNFQAPQISTNLKNSKGNSEVIFDEQVVKLGVAMELPDGMMAKLKGRSSLTKNHGVLIACSGEMDNSYKGDTDEWMLRLLAIRNGSIKKHDRIAQFEVVPSQKSTFWQKLKWLFSSGVELIKVDSLNNPGRNGFGSTGIK